MKNSGLIINTYFQTPISIMHKKNLNLEQKNISFSARIKFHGVNVWSYTPVDNIPKHIREGMNRDKLDEVYRLSRPEHIAKPCAPLTAASVCSQVIDKVKTIVEKGIHKREAIFLRMLFKESGKNNPEARRLAKILRSTDANSPDYIEQVISSHRLMGAGLETEININSLKNIVKSNEPCIFIINHDDLGHDLTNASILLKSLYSKYKMAGRDKESPKPYLILAKSVLESYPDDIKTIYEKTGAIAVNHNIYTSEADRKYNQVKLKPVKEGFISGKNHIFIFPEGVLAAYKNKLKNLEDRFNTGIASLIRKACCERGRVKVIPVGLAYTNINNSKLGSIEIGEPLYFIKEGDNLRVSTGNLTPYNVDEAYNKFFFPSGNNTQIPESKIIQSDNGAVNLNDKRMKQYISGILVENLKVIVQKAKDKIS